MRPESPKQTTDQGTYFQSCPRLNIDHRTGPGHLGPEQLFGLIRSSTGYRKSKLNWPNASRSEDLEKLNGPLSNGNLKLKSLYRITNGIIHSHKLGLFFAQKKVFVLFFLDFKFNFWESKSFQDFWYPFKLKFPYRDHGRDTLIHWKHLKRSWKGLENLKNLKLLIWQRGKLVIKNSKNTKLRNWNKAAVRESQKFADFPDFGSFEGQGAIFTNYHFHRRIN